MVEKEIIAILSLIFFIVLIAFIVFLFLFIKQLWMKGNVHFRLLKELYPNELDEVKSKGSFIWFGHLFKLSFIEVIWYFFPIYVNIKSVSEMTDKALACHLKLRRVNFRILTYIGLCVLSLLIGWTLSILLN